MTTGRLELTETPAAVGSMGVIRLRASSGDDRVEGQINVKVCD